jgi:hypothetical protein
MKKLNYLILCITMSVFFVIPSSYAQNKKNIKKATGDFIKIIDEKGTNTDFVFKTPPRFELVNGMLNISALSDNNMLFEITGISEKALRDTMLSDASFKMMYIFSQNEKACVSNPMTSNSILNIKCSSSKKGTPITITLSGNLFGSSKILILESKLSGAIPERKNTITRKTN